MQELGFAYPSQLGFKLFWGGLQMGISILVHIRVQGSHAPAHTKNSTDATRCDGAMPHGKQGCELAALRVVWA